MPSAANVICTAGVVDYLSKPFDPEFLLAKVGWFVSLWQRGVLIERQRETIRERELEAARAQTMREAAEAATRARLVGDVAEAPGRARRLAHHGRQARRADGGD